MKKIKSPKGKEYKCVVCNKLCSSQDKLTMHQKALNHRLKDCLCHCHCETLRLHRYPCKCDKSQWVSACMHCNIGCKEHGKYWHVEGHDNATRYTICDNCNKQCDPVTENPGKKKGRPRKQEEDLVPGMPGLYVPILDETYYYCEGDKVQSRKWDGSGVDQKRLKHGNVFKTYEEADQFELKLVPKKQ